MAALNLQEPTEKGWIYNNLKIRAAGISLIQTEAQTCRSISTGFLWYLTGLYLDLSTNRLLARWLENKGMSVVDFGSKRWWLPSR